ncbi:MAG: YggS family pyridoxal phosphate-dependent enzyme [Neisseriaceae bacterium]
MHDKNVPCLQTVLERIEKAKSLTGRTDEIKLVAVSKHFPAQNISSLYAKGLRNFGENYVQEWLQKKAMLPEDIMWHVIGRVQSNKIKRVAQHADWLQTLDRPMLGEKIEQYRSEDKVPLQVCIEINISEEPQKAGLPCNQLEDLVAAILPYKKLCLRGLMCIPQTHDPILLQEEMHKMQELFTSLKATVPTVDTLSMGMSADLELAIRYGSTMLRVGSALFGKRT